MDMLPVDYTFADGNNRLTRGRTTLTSCKHQELATGSVETGGVESLLVFFADSIRLADGSQNQQSLALMNLFKVIQSTDHYMIKFLDELNGLKLIEFILVHPICIITKQMLEFYLDLSIIKTTQHSDVIKSPKLISNLLSCWRAWHKDLNVARALYRKLIDLTQPISSLTHSRLSIDCKEENYFINKNFETMTQANCMDTLLSILRECLCPCDGDAPKIDHESINLIINLISLLIRHPPRLDMILDIMDLLIFLHPDTKSYTEINYDRLAFLHPIYSNIEPDNIEAPEGRSFPGEDRMMGTISEVSDEDIESTGSDSYLSTNSRDYRNLTSGTTSIDAVDKVTAGPGYSDQSANEQANQRWPTGESESAWDYPIKSSSDDEAGNKIMTGEESRVNYSNVRANEQEDDYQCTHRNYAIALTADMLASIVKLTTKYSPEIIIEIMQKSIIEPKKLVIFANNEATIVREKVLRLFLTCIRSCYSLNLKQILVNYQCDNKRTTTGFKCCVPIQLMRFQLMEYPTSMRMIQMCYGIIVGIEEFEDQYQLCEMFDIETTNNSLQTNTLILLIHLMSQLKDPIDICSSLRFVYAYVKQLIDLCEYDIITVLLDNDLIDSLMKIYFAYVDYEIYKSESGDKQDLWSTEDINTDDQFEKVCLEVDRLILLITRYFIQNLETDETMRSVDELMTYLDLMNTNIPAEYKSILRDRKAKIVMVMMSYCEHYERVAKRKKTGGILDWLTTNKLKAFSNYLSESQLELILTPEPYLKVDYSEDAGDLDNRLFSNVESFDERRRRGSLELGDRIAHQDDSYCDRVPITEHCVIQRFSTTIDYARRFILTREAGVIPSPLERSFIIRCLRILSNHIMKYNDFCRPNRRRVPGFHEFVWSKMLPKLVDTMRSSFKDIVLFLLSPSDSTNLDERRYYAFELMKMFSEEQLVMLLDDESCKLTFGALIAFIGDIVHREGTNLDSDEYSAEQQADDELLMMDTESRLLNLVNKLSHRINYTGIVTQIINGSGITEDGREASTRLDSPDHLQYNFNEIWMDELNQLRQDSQDKMETLKIEMQLLARDVLSGDAELQLASSDCRIILGAKLASEARGVTHEVLGDKNELRKSFLLEVKRNKVTNYQLCQQWLSLINGQTHERAMWHMEDFYPRHWELNPIEGPSRVRRRLRACRLPLERRFFRSSNFGNQTRPRRSMSPRSSIVAAHLNRTAQTDKDELWIVNNWSNSFNFHPLCSMIINHEKSLDSDELRTKIFTSDIINFNCDCSIIRLNEVCNGELLIASRCVHFIGQLEAPKRGSSLFQPIGLKNNTGDKPRQANGKYSPILTIVEDLWFDEIVEIWDRRYQLQDVGLEIFMTNNMTYLLAFRCTADREDFKQNLMRKQDKMVNLQQTNQSSTLNRLIQYWRAGRLTNFDFLTCLNKLAGRSFNDLMQYPVFPFILSNYTGHELDLNQASNFRDLSKPMAVQNKSKEPVFLANYQDSLNSGLSVGLEGLKKRPYHYGNHYSNSATVLHFLVRLPPFTQMLIQYQDDNFDQPDRTFHSLASTWQSITNDSNTDFKELIPEFFYLPEMFVNSEHFELGTKQNNELVDDVRLPPWCPNEDPRLFTLIHRQALESDQVSAQLHQWVDLIFGYKQTGPAAVEAVNVFHPATYYGMVALDEDQLPAVFEGPSPLASRKATGTSGNRWKLKMSSQSAESERLAKSWPNRANSDLEAPQREIERLALATMIKTYGQMPKQLFTQPLRQRQLIRRQPQQQQGQLRAKGQQLGGKTKRQPAQASDRANSVEHQLPEPLKQVKGIRWGSYVGSPEESEITAVRHIRIEPVTDDPLTDYTDLINEDASQRQSVSSPSMKANGGQTPASSSSLSLSSSRSTTRRLRQLQRRAQSHSLCRLANGDVVVLRPGTSLLLDKRLNSKSLSSGDRQQLSPTARYMRRADISGSGPVNWFMSMILSQQQSLGSMDQYQSSSSTSSSSSGISSLASNGSAKAALAKAAKVSPSQPTSHSAAGASSSLAKSVPLPGALARDKLLTGNLALASWSAEAGAVRIRHPGLRKTRNSQISTIRRTSPSVDQMSCCNSVPELNLLLLGYQSGSVCAHIVSSSMVPGGSQLNGELGTSLASSGRSGYQSQASASSRHSSSTSRNEWPIGSGISAATMDENSMVASTEVAQEASEVLLPNRQGNLSPPPTSSKQPLLSPFGKQLGTMPLERAIHQTTRWLYCHRKRVTAIQANVNFGVLVTGSDDGTCAIWDLNTLTYVRSIDYKLQSLSRKQWAASLRASSANARQANLQQQQQSRRRRISSSSRDSPSRSGSQSHWQGRNKIGDDSLQSGQLLDFLCSCELQQQRPDDLSASGASPRATDPRGPFFGSQETVVQGCVCESGINLIAISDTLGDIVTIKDMSNRLAGQDDQMESEDYTDDFNNNSNDHYDLDDDDRRDFEGSSMVAARGKSPVGRLVRGLSPPLEPTDGGSSTGSNSSSILYCHTVNGYLVGIVNCQSQVTAVCYSNAPEGISVNVIVVGLADGQIRLYSSWDLSFVKEFHVSGFNSPVTSLMYTRDSQLLYVVYDDDQLVVLRNKRRGGVSLPKEWYP